MEATPPPSMMLGVVEKDGLHLPVLTKKNENGEDELVILKDIIKEIELIAKESVIEELPAPDTLTLVVSLFNSLGEHWLTPEDQLVSVLLPKKKFGMLGIITTAYLMGRYVKGQNIEISQEVISKEDIPNPEDLLPLFSE